MPLFTPVNNRCLNCQRLIDPKTDRHELAMDIAGDWRRRCGRCIEQLKKTEDELSRKFLKKEAK